MSVIMYKSMLFSCLLWFAVHQTAFATPPAHPPKRLVSFHTVVKLTYRDKPTRHIGNPYSVGYFGIEESGFNPTFMGTDQAGHVFVMDPLTVNYQVLKSFTASGHCNQIWQPLKVDASTPSTCACTQDGHIWVGLEEDVKQWRGLPIVVYKFGQKAPVIDWRNELPVVVDQSIHQALAKKGLTWKRQWLVGPIETGGRYVSINLSGNAVGSQGNLGRTLWLLVNSDGTKVYQAQVTSGDKTRLLTPEGQILTWNSDLRISPDFFWSKVWLKQPQSGRTFPLLNLARNREPYAPYLYLGHGLYPPTVQIGPKGRMYLFFERDVLNAKTKNYGGEAAVVVLNKHRNMIAYLPWTSDYISDLAWVKVRPTDGSLLRMELFHKDARIVSYAVP